MSLVYSDFQLFMKRLRKARHGQVIRFYMCGEYGDNFGRPHFHACLFGCFFPDRTFLRDLPSGSRLYESAELQNLWPHGYSSIGDVTFESAAYVARYVMKKMTGNNAEQHYQLLDQESGEVIDRVPEFNRMSLKPGIGAAWLEKYGSEVYPRDTIVVNGKKCKPPRYYDKMLEAAVNSVDGRARDFARDILAHVEDSRLISGIKLSDNNTPERLNVREIVAKARLSLSKRGL